MLEVGPNFLQLFCKCHFCGTCNAWYCLKLTYMDQPWIWSMNGLNFHHQHWLRAGRLKNHKSRPWDVTAHNVTVCYCCYTKESERKFTSCVGPSSNQRGGATYGSDKNQSSPTMQARPPLVNSGGKSGMISTTTNFLFLASTLLIAFSEGAVGSSLLKESDFCARILAF